MKIVIWEVMNLKLLLSVFLIYESTVYNIIPCGEWKLQKSTKLVKVEIAQACVEKTTEELYRNQFKDIHEAEENKFMVEIGQYRYRIEEIPK